MQPLSSPPRSVATRTPPPASRTAARGTPETSARVPPTTAAACRKRPPTDLQKRSVRKTLTGEAQEEEGGALRPSTPPELEQPTRVESPVTLCHQLRGTKTLQIHELQLPLTVLQRVCMRLPEDHRRGNLVGAFLPSNLGLSTRAEWIDALRLLHERVAEHTEHTTRPMLLRLVLRNKEGETAACQITPKAMLLAARPLAASTSRGSVSLAACASKPPARGGALLAEAISLSSTPRSRDPGRAAIVH
mmetsp:Transcript_6385/g.12773  ORF Transcript_6385/g.12773 Transcript_6385/m.12773 type:complete len:247 (-) Transcript_6385:15-755(-)